jgi:hypothetical protein
MADLKPTPKLAAAGTAGALTIVIVYVASLAGLDVPEYVATAVGVLITWAAGYLKSEGMLKRKDGRHEAT